MQVSANEDSRLYCTLFAILLIASIFFAYISSINFFEATFRFRSLSFVFVFVRVLHNCTFSTFTPNRISLKPYFQLSSTTCNPPIPTHYHHYHHQQMKRKRDIIRNSLSLFLSLARRRVFVCCLTHSISSILLLSMLTIV